VRIKLVTPKRTRVEEYKKILKKVRTWLDDAHIPHNLAPQAKLDARLLFSVNVQQGQIIIYTTKRIHDRLILQSQINFGDDIKMAISRMKKVDFNEFVINFTDKLVTYGSNWAFNGKEQQLNDMYHYQFIHYSSLTKDRFFQTIARLNVISKQITRMLPYYLGRTQSLGASQNIVTSDSTPYG
jgi:hypothetical protein